MNLNKKALGVAVAVALLSTSAFAVSPYGNTNQKSSLLIFPLIDISKGRDTLIRITNDFSSSVSVKCYYQATDDAKIRIKYRADFSFQLTKTHPAHWWASTGQSTGNATIGAINVREFGNMPSNGAAGDNGEVPVGKPEIGEMKCWAVNNGISAPINFNHLIGSATVFDREEGTATEYNAWGFQALPLNDTVRTQVGTVTDTDNGTEVQMKLNGALKQYDKVPNSNLGQFTPVGKRTKDKNNPFAADKDDAEDWTILYLASGTQDFRQGGPAIITKYAFTFYNQDETGYTGEHVCADSWLEKYLKDFWSASYDALGTDSAYYRVESNADKGICGKDAVKVGMVGVQVHGTFGKSGRDVAELKDKQRDLFVRAVPTHGKGATDGAIFWDSGADDNEVKAGN